MSRWCDRLVIGGILFLIVFTPFAFGAVHPWAFSIMEALLFLLVAVWMAKLCYLARSAEGTVEEAEIEPQGAGSKGQGAERVALYILPLALVAIFGLLQLLPLPPSVLRALSPRTFELYSQSLSGWPEGRGQGTASREQRAPSEVTGPRSPVPGQTSEVRSNPQSQISKSEIPRAPVILPTPEDVQHGAAVPFEHGAGSGERAEQSAGEQRSEVRDRRSEIVGLKDSASRLLTSDLRSLVFNKWLPLSVAPSLTRTDLLKFAAYAALFFLVWLYPMGDTWQLNSKPFAYTGLRRVEERFLRSLVVVVLLTGLLIAATGFVQRFAWNGRILWFFIPYDWGSARPVGVPRASGPFINPDHFANYLSLILPIALACVLFRTSIVSRALEHGVRIFSALTALLLFTGILLSLSRIGWLSALLGIVILLWFSRWRVEDENWALLKKQWAPFARVFLMIVCVLLLVSLFFLGPEGREQVDTRLGETVTEDVGLWGRTSIWKDSFAMARDFPLFGVGLGAWPDLFPRYQRGPWTAGFYRQAHNDYVQFWVETGIIGFGLLAWFFVRVGKQLYQRLTTISARSVPLMAALVAALGVMAFHELFDFNLQIPANAFLFTLLLALAMRIAGPAISDEGSVVFSHPSAVINYRSPLSRLPAFLSVAIGAVALVLAVSALRQEQIPYPYNLKEPDSVAQAREMLLSHPARASSHFALLRLLEDKAPLDWQMSEAGIALWLDPSNPYLRDLYASILLRLGKTDQGLSEITQSVFNSPSLSTHFYLRENLLPWLSTGEQKAVEEGFKEALARGYPQALGDFAVFYARLDRFSDQGMLYEQAAAKESDGQKKAEVMINSGLAYAKAGQENKAERLFRDVIKTLPNDPRAYQHLVTAIYGVKKDLAGAQEIVSYGIKNGVPPFSLYLALAQAAQQAGRPDEVKASLQSAKTEVERSANNGEDPYPRYLLLADAARGAGDREQEIAVLLQALELRPRSSDTLFRLAGVYMQENNFDRAALYYSKIANINPNSPDVYYSLALAEEGRYHFADADKAYARAMELAPENDNYRQRYESFKGRVEQNRKKQEAESREQ